MAGPLPEPVLDRLFRVARTRNWWLDHPVSEADIRAIYDLAKWGPTSANTTPARFVWLTTEAAKARLAPLVAEANREKMLKAPVTAIVGYDLDFAATLGQLAPHNPAAPSWFEKVEVAEYEAFRSGTLQGAYLIMAARALGFDCGPLGGIDRAAVDREFFAETRVRTNFVVSLGHGSDERLRPRAPRLAFEQACRIL